MRINRVMIRNFRGMREVDFHPGQYNVFIGPNNSGKSNILEALNYAIGAMLTIPLEKFDYYGENEDIGSQLRIEISLNLSRGECDWQNESPELIRKVIPNSVDFEITRDGKRSSLREDVKNVQEHEIDQKSRQYGANASLLKSFLHISLSNFRRSICFHKEDPRIVPNEKLGADSTQENWQDMLSQGRAIQCLREVLRNWERNNDLALQRFLTYFQRLFPTLSLSDVDETNYYELILTYGKENLFLNPITFGLGTQRVSNLLLNIAETETGCLLIDEPELHLHPGLQRSLAKLLLDLSDRRQFFLASHSPSFLNFTKTAKIFLVQDLAQGTELIELTNLDDARILKEIIGFENRDILFDNLIVLVEGESDSIALKKLLDASSDLKHWELESLKWVGETKPSQRRSGSF